MSRVTLVPLALLSLSLPAALEAIPVFARRYRVSCLLCHNPVPSLNAFGDRFAANGFRLASREPPRDTVATGDPLLALAADLPLALRLDAYAQAYSKGSVTDFAAPYVIKVLASGPLSRSLSYYMYVNLLERGEFGGFEDAILVADDIGGTPVDLALGQFQVSDPLFKRELRLSFEDYAVYRARIGDERATLTYDRGLMLGADVAGFGVTAMLLNGNGIGPVDEERRFDDNDFKTLAGHLTREVAPGVRLGAFGYYGRSNADGRLNRVRMFGGDGTFSSGIVEVNAQFLHREDTNPLFAVDASAVETDGGFLEALLRPGNSRWHGFMLYNLVSSTRQMLDVGLGGPGDTRRYQTLTGGLGYLVMRNVKVSGEAMWDFEQERMRWTFGVVTAF